MADETYSCGMADDAPVPAPTMRSRPFEPIDFILVVLLMMLVAFSFRHAIGSHDAPTEDAAMLLRYSQHVAAGQGITWNVGEHPVEGATDFLYMAAVGEWARLGRMDAVVASRELQCLCLLLLPMVGFVCSRLTLGAQRWLAFAIGLYLASMPGSAYVLSGFGAPFMMLMVALTCWAALAMIAAERLVGWGEALRFSLLALLVGLTRPEGNVMAVLLLATVVFLLGGARTRSVIVTFAVVFALLGGAYFAWRLRYFGYALPNPFYVKGGGRLHPQGLGNGAENVVKILWPVFPLMALALRNARSRRLLKAVAIPLIGYTMIWVLLSNENNAMFRFQMPVLPVALLFLPLLLEGVMTELRWTYEELTQQARRGVQLAAALYVVSVCYIFYRSFEAGASHNSAVEYGEHLRQYADRGYTMAVTEAGTFPYFSRWKAIDLLGLNDATIAHEGISEAYLDRYKPELILYHLYATVGGTGWLHRDQDVVRARDRRSMQVAHAYAVDHGYILAAAYASDPCSLHFFYVRPNTPDTDAIVDYLRTTPYYFLDNGGLSTDFRNGVRPECHIAPL